MSENKVTKGVETPKMKPLGSETLGVEPGFAGCEPIESETIREEDSGLNLDEILQNNVPSNRISKRIGFAICIIQLILSVVFIFTLSRLNLLPTIHLVLLCGILLMIWAIPFITQIFSTRKGIVGKVLSILISLSLIAGIIYSHQLYASLQDFTVEGRTVVNIDRMVVAVLDEHPAQTLEDAKDLSFGVQFNMRGDEVQATINSINETLGTSIETREFVDMMAQVDALFAGYVEAIIYNEAFNGMLEEHREYGFIDYIRVIYILEIETEVELEEIVLELEEDIFADNDSFILYISGLDMFGRITTTGLSDVNVLAVVNPTTRQILLVNTPRDYYVILPGVSGEQGDKLTHAGTHGVHVSVATLSYLYQLEIAYYLRLNFTSFVQIIDAIGGVDVYSQHGFFASESGMFIQQGMNHLNGHHALGFARERKNIPGGDFQRGRNHQALITGILARAMSPSVLIQAPNIMNDVSESIDTNVPMDFINDSIRGQLEGRGSWNIMSVDAEGRVDSLPCFSLGGLRASVVVPDEESVEAIREMMIAVIVGELFGEGERLEMLRD